jgi:hypothetical protein
MEPLILSEIHQWLLVNKVKDIPDKTEATVFGSKQLLRTRPSDLRGAIALAPHRAPSRPIAPPNFFNDPLIHLNHLKMPRRGLV